jgi:hypothetical protein
MGDVGWFDKIGWVRAMALACGQSSGNNVTLATFEAVQGRSSAWVKPFNPANVRDMFQSQP